MSVPRWNAEREELSEKAETILAAAEHAFLARGFGAVTMDAIAREAGVSKATVYAHFTGKEELFGAVIAHVSARRYDVFSIETLDPRDITASLTTIATRFLDLVLAPEVVALNRIIIGEVTRFPALAQVFWTAGPARMREQLEAFFRRAGEAGALVVPDPRQAAEQFAALARGEIHLRGLFRVEEPGDPTAVSTAAAGAVATFLRAFRA